MKYPAYKYCLKVWLTSAAITPLIVMPFMFAIGHSIATSLSVLFYGYVYLVALMLAVSLIPWLLVLIFLNSVVQSERTIRIKKMIIGLVVIVLPGVVFLTGFLASEASDTSGLLGYLAFVLGTGLCLWFYKLKQVTVNGEQPLNSTT